MGRDAEQIDVEKENVTAGNEHDVPMEAQHVAEHVLIDYEE